MSETTVDEATPLVLTSQRTLLRSDQRTTFQRNLAVYLILFSAGFERLAFYSLAGNLTFFLDSKLISWRFPHTIIAPLIFLGTSYISAIVFSWISDGRLGRAKTILIGFTIYCIGYTFMILFANEHMHQNWCPLRNSTTEATAPDFFHELCIQYILPTLIITAIGVGAVQANMAVFGAEQVREQRSRMRYFDIYYAAVNTGGLLAFGAIAYLQINKGYFVGYLIPGVLLFLAFILFVLGCKCYVHIKPQDAVITAFLPVVINAFQSWRTRRRSQSGAINRNELHREQPIVETEADSTDYLSFTVSRPSWSFLDHAKVENNGRFPDRIVNDIKSLRRIMVVFLLLTPYWLLYVQVETTFIVQGAHMKLPTSFKRMPVVWLSLANQMIIIVTIFVLNTFVYKRLQASGRSFPINTRIVIGMTSAALSMCMAGTVEIFRQNICKTQNFTQIIADKEYVAANMSVFFQFPQYVGIGLSEVFTSVASLEFAYLAAPQSAQSLIMSLRFCSAGLSSFFGSGIVGLMSIEMTEASIDEGSPLIFHTSSIPSTPDHRTDFQRKLSVWLILISAGLERLAFYSLAGNLVLFLTSDVINWTPLHSVTASFIFLGTSYISALIFAWISDGKLGRAKTIIIGFLLYIIGYAFISLFSDNDQYKLYSTFCGRSNLTVLDTVGFFQEQCIAQILSTLILTAIGVGAVQANMAVFGAEQVREQRATTQYFDKYYAAVNIGGLIAFAFIAYGQQNDSYFIGYIIPSGLLIIALILFLIGYRFCIHIVPHDSVISNIIPVLINAFQTWRKHRRNSQILTNNRRQNSSTVLLDDPVDYSDQFSITTSGQTWSFLDYAKISNQGKFIDRTVDDIKSLRRIIVVFLLLIPYWLLYFQIETTFLVQGVHMKVMKFFRTDQGDHYMPVIWLSLGDQIIIIVAIFFLNTFVYKRLRASGRSISIRFRITIGMMSAALAMCMAGTVEIFRQKLCDSPPTIEQIIGKTNYTAADMSIFYQFPQYIGIGLSEVFASVASLEFAYLAAPRSAQSLIMSLRFCSAGLSSFFGSFYIGIFVKIKQDLAFENSSCKAADEPELFFVYFFVLAAFQVFFILVFLACDRKFHILKVSKQRFNTRLFVAPTSRSSTRC
ncbi:unnamed protein product [Adineta ricciae]|uniref:Uncharacterized protein n=1 Tax=Adineta ricciae TaxID=249248 RepID=A0A815WCK2_ADIRI|nr:unnamed protein product [Adineta ricciae]